MKENKNQKKKKEENILTHIIVKLQNENAKDVILKTVNGKKNTYKMTDLKQ